MEKVPRVNVDILVVRDGKVLLGLLTDKWKCEGRNVWGVPGRDIRFGEKIGDTVKRNIREEFGCGVTRQEVICVNANRALGNHYVGIGVVAEIDGEPRLLIPEDWKEWRWFPREEIPDDLFPAAGNLIECYLKKRFTFSE
jgi:ADP-ribose pyrophosphatase YjhB (NUDIX family)